MKPKKEHYRQKLPHYQQPGQWYSATVSLEGAIPKGAMALYSLKLNTAKIRYYQLLNQQNAHSLDTDFPRSMIPNQNKEEKNTELGNSKSRLTDARKAYHLALQKYRLAFEKVLHQSTEPTISLLKPNNLKVIQEA